MIPKSGLAIQAHHGCSHRHCSPPGSLRAILTQVDKEGNFYAFSFASHQLKEHKKILTLPSRSRGLHQGLGLLQQISQGQAVHLVLRPQALGEARSPAQ